MSRFPLSFRVHSVVLVLLAAAFLAASFSVLPAAASESPGIMTNDDAKALAKLDDEWSTAAGTRDADRVSAFYAEDAVAYPPNEPMAVGRAAAKKVWAAYFSEPTFNISWKTLHAGVSQSGDLGFTSGTYEATYKGPDGKQVAEKGKYLCTWKKGSDGKWKATHDMWNADSK